MRAIASGNLTVELIRAERFDVAYRNSVQAERCPHDDMAHSKHHEVCRQRTDRVELCPEAMEYGRSTTPADQVDPSRLITTRSDEGATQTQEAAEPRPLSPVVGSTALGGLGIASIVPGTLLDVVA